MGLLSMEHGKWAYRADFAVYGAAVLVLGAFLGLGFPQESGLAMAGYTLAGAATWTALEYLLHRFVLHGLPPFRAWHAEHHARPTALICAPTLLSGTLIASLVFLPAWAVGGLWRACAVTLGVLAGYLAYAMTHHTMHHGRTRAPWVRQRRRWHARHHHAAVPACYGVTSGFWDHVFGTAIATREP